MKIFHGLNELQSLINSEQQRSLHCGLHFTKTALNGCWREGQPFLRAGKACFQTPMQWN
jgi:hypothetical protein